MADVALVARAADGNDAKREFVSVVRTTIHTEQDRGVVVTMTRATSGQTAHV